jgi:hypothetical protein
MIMAPTSLPKPRSHLPPLGPSFIVLGGVGVIAVVLRVPLLRPAGQTLVADDGFIVCSHVALLGGDRRYDAAAKLVAGDHVGGVLLIESEPTRIQTLGLVPTDSALERRELSRRGVPTDRLTIVPGQARTVWDWARARRVADGPSGCDRPGVNRPFLVAP